MSALNNKSPYIINDQKISFTFDGKKYFGFKGDTIASALLRNNIRLIGRSFKYHRPRGIYTCGIEEPNALVQIPSEYNDPNISCLLYTSPSPRDRQKSRMPSSA